jgi:hypothetical protein
VGIDYSVLSIPGGDGALGRLAALIGLCVRADADDRNGQSDE